MTPRSARPDVLQGTLDMLVLKALQLGSMHGWGITEILDRGSGGIFQVGQGSLYPALYRLEHDAMIRSEWRLSDHNRRARYYELTATGRKRLAAERAQWRTMSAAVERILDLRSA